MSRAPAFTSLSVILPVINETYLLKQTVDTIMEGSAREIEEILIVVCQKTTPESLKACEELKHKYGAKIKVFSQTLPFLGGAMRDSFDRAAGSHTLMMASDMETPPDRVKDFIAEAKKHPDWIITGSRWIRGGGFAGYSKLKYFLNYIFQHLFSLLYFTNLTDMTYGYRLFPTALLKRIRWEETRHPFLLETMVKPLRLGIKVKEIPTAWKPRSEGDSQNTFFRNFQYFGIGCRVRFARRKELLK
jgi:glycosyltransferase involved in cell wall biosynthesis